MSAAYPTPATPLPWYNLIDTQYRDDAYILHAANVFPHLVAALEAMLREDPFGLASSGARRALAIARGEVTP